jgi:hypothetical protein
VDPRWGAGPDNLFPPVLRLAITNKYQHRENRKNVSKSLHAPRAGNVHHDGPAGWDGGTMERSCHSPRDDARALFLPCSGNLLSTCSEAHGPAHAARAIIGDRQDRF